MAASTQSGPWPEKIIVEHRAPAGILAGALGCGFGILGIFVIATIFVPLAALCAVVGLIRGVGSRSVTAIGLSLVAGFLSFVGFLASPVLMLLFGVSLFAAAVATHSSPSAPPPAPRAQYALVMPQPSDPGAARPPMRNDAATPNPLAAIPARAAALTTRLQHFDDAADHWLTGVSSVEDHYRRITAKMNALYRQEQGLAGDGDAAVTRSQLSIAIGQGQIAADQVHFQAQSDQSQIENAIAPLSQAVAALAVECQNIAGPGVAAGPWTASCQEFSGAAATARDESRKLKSGFAAAEAIYQQEQRTQNNLVEASGRIE